MAERRRTLTEAWSLAEPVLVADVGAPASVRLLHDQVQLLWDDLVPVGARETLQRLGVSDLFLLECVGGWPEDDTRLTTLAENLQDELEGSRLHSHGFTLTSDSTGPLVLLDDPVTGSGAATADSICEAFAARNAVGAGWVADDRGPMYAAGAVSEA